MYLLLVPVLKQRLNLFYAHKNYEKTIKYRFLEGG